MHSVSRVAGPRRASKIVRVRVVRVRVVRVVAAPDMYLGSLERVRPWAQAEGAGRVDPPGEPVRWHAGRTR